MNRLWRWVGDLLFGMKLAVAGRRAWGRFVLTALGLGLGVVVLLGAASLPQMHDARDEREGRRPTTAELGAEAQQPPTVLMSWESQAVGDVQVSGILLDELARDAPVPAGLQRLPREGEVVVSPALERLLQSPDGAELRPRLGGEVVGTIGDGGLLGPGELLYYRGVDGLSATGTDVGEAAHDYAGSGASSLNPQSWVMLVLGAAALLVPVMVFVSSTTRLAEAARQRRLAALRLVGASAGQVRRIAAGEVLVGVLLGVAFGWSLFAAARMSIANFPLPGPGVFVHDMWPGWAAGTLITVGIPVLAALTAVGVMQRMIIEPLGVARRGAARYRMSSWRGVPLVLGLAWMTVAVVADTRGVFSFGGPIVLVLIGVALVLPWAVDRVVAGRTGSSLAWQLAVRRLQLAGDSSARSVSAVAVVLTGLIALQTLIASAEANVDRFAENQTSAPGKITVQGSRLPEGDAFEDIIRELATIPDAELVSASVDADMIAEDGTTHLVSIMDCSLLVPRVGPHQQCRDGDVFSAPASQAVPIHEGALWKPEWRMYEPVERGAEARWAVPADRQPLQDPSGARPGFASSELVLTPRAADGIPELAGLLRVEIEVPPGHAAAALERSRDIAAGNLAGGEVFQSAARTQEQTSFQVIRYGLFLGAVITFVLIGCGLLVAATEQVQERRRHLAVLGAVGVPRKTLVWAVFLQNGVVMLIAAVLALIVGTPLGILTRGGIAGGLHFDVAGTLALVAMAAAAVLAVTAATLPSLGRALRPEGLRTE